MRQRLSIVMWTSGVSDVLHRSHSLFHRHCSRILLPSLLFFFFFFNDTATTEIYPLSYTTLFRSVRARLFHRRAADRDDLLARRVRPARLRRSEEHTSELQSHSHLVCRLLLEKKKNKEKNEQHNYKTYV